LFLKDNLNAKPDYFYEENLSSQIWHDNNVGIMRWFDMLL